MTQHSSNASNVTLAALIAGSPLGRFAALIITKKGKVTGRGAAKCRKGDDRVHDVIFMGRVYMRLVQRSLDIALGTTAQALLDECNRRGVTGKSGAPITLADCTKAIDDLIASFKRTLGGTSESTTDHVYEPLVVDGKQVRGCRVYTGPGNPSDPKAPIPGTIYIQGLLVGRKVLVPAANGPIPKANSRGDVAAKGVLRSMTPIARYVSYALEPGADYMLRTGKQAIDEATTQGVPVKSGAQAQLAAIS